MYRIIDERSSGKTGRLFLLAKEQDGVIACANPRAMRIKAANYGITGIDFIPYEEVIGYNFDKPLFIDELEVFLKQYCNRSLAGYTMSKEGN